MRTADRELLEAIRRDLNDFKRDVGRWQKRHQDEHAADRLQHDEDARRAKSSRRFLITTWLTVVALLVTIMTMIFQLLGRIRLANGTPAGASPARPGNRPLCRHARLSVNNLETFFQRVAELS